MATKRFASSEAEEWIGKKIPCLDHGFVYLVDYMGGDASIVQAARVSYGLGTKSVHEDRGLIRYLMRHQHTTPFEMVEFKFHVKLPIFVARQWIRHRTACLAGDTRLVFDVQGRSKCHRMAIEEVYRLWHTGVRDAQRDRLRRLRLRMCDESSGEIRHTAIVDVWQTGVKPVLRVVLENGDAIKMTRDHRCLTEDGWMTLGHATHVQAERDQAIEWDRQAPAFAVNGVPAHRGPARLDGSGYPRLVRTFSRIARIELAGEEMTYDLAVSGPYHNFVADGFIVHNSVNEYSGRYSIMSDEFYLPAIEQVTTQSKQNRQGGGEGLDPERARAVLKLLEREQREVRQGYEQMLDWDVRRELARINLGVSEYTEWYWKSNLHNVFHFLQLRLDAHAQYEIRVYAEAMAQIVRAVAPVAFEAFEDYQLHSERLSRLELGVLSHLLGTPSEDSVMKVLPAAWRERTSDGQLKRNRERDEFLAKLKRLAAKRPTR